jgi:hypothetical protein
MSSPTYTKKKKELSTFDALVNAKQLLVAYGWGQHGYAKLKPEPVSEEDCTRCLLGALEGWTVYEDGSYDTTVVAQRGSLDFINRAIREGNGEWSAGRGISTSIISWNDADGRTEEEVLAVLDRAIELAQDAGY